MGGSSMVRSWMGRSASMRAVIGGHVAGVDLHELLAVVVFAVGTGVP